jgi:hypothetical protein
LFFASNIVYGAGDRPRVLGEEDGLPKNQRFQARRRQAAKIQLYQGSFKNSKSMFTKTRKIYITHTAEHYCAWPDLVKANNGRLLCSYSACVQHGDRSFTQLFLLYSDDDGESWSEPYPVTEACGIKAGYYYNNTSMNILGDGRIALAYDRIEGNDEDSSPKRIVLRFSSDGGVTWSDPMITPAVGIVPDKLLELPGGRWLLGCHQKDFSLGKLVQRLWYSDNQGETWHGPVIVGCDAGLNLCEASILPIGDTLVAIMRENSSMGWPAYRTFSHDQGETWSKPVAFPLHGCHRPKTGFLSDGRILITYRYRPGGASAFRNVFMGITDSKSMLETEPANCYADIYPFDCDRTALEPDTGYTGWVELDPGELVVVNYIKDDAPKARICCYKLNLNQ